VQTRTISLKRLAAFAPPQLASALRDEDKSTFTVADVTALVGRFEDSQDFDSTTYLSGVLETLKVEPLAAPPDPLAKARLSAELAKAATAISKATGMPRNHAELYAEAGFTVEQSERGWKAGLQGGQAFMYGHLGLSADEAIGLAEARVDSSKAYELIEAKVPAGLIPKAIAADMNARVFSRYKEKGFSPPDAIELAALELSADNAPNYLTLAQVKVAREKGYKFTTLYTLVGTKAFTFQQAQVLLDAVPKVEPYSIAAVQRLGKLSFDEVLAIAQSPTLKTNHEAVPYLVAAGFSVDQVSQCADISFKMNEIDHVLGSGYSPAELITLWQSGLGLAGAVSGQMLPTFHAAGFTLDQLFEVRPAGLGEFSVKGFETWGFSPDEMLSLARAGCGSTLTFKNDYLSLGISPREAFELIVGG
jgi:hypothetical protein